MTAITTTRRNLLATAAAVPLLPVAAHGARVPLSEPDPAVAAYERWITARQEWNAYCEANEHRWVNWDDDEKDAGYQAHTEAERAACRALEEIAPTTPAGAAALVCYFLDSEGILVAPADPATLSEELEDAGFNYVNGATVVRSLLEGLRGMA